MPLTSLESLRSRINDLQATGALNEESLRHVFADAKKQRLTLTTTGTRSAPTARRS